MHFLYKLYGQNYPMQLRDHNASPADSRESANVTMLLGCVVGAGFMVRFLIALTLDGRRRMPSTRFAREDYTTRETGPVPRLRTATRS